MKNNSIKRVFFRAWDLNEAAYKVYTDISFIFFKDDQEIFYFAECPKSDLIKIGNKQDLESFLIEYSAE